MRSASSFKEFAHIAVKHLTTGEIFAFRMRTFPFGAVRSVNSFLRISFSLWHVLVKEFSVLATNYFDDFITLSTTCEASSVSSCVHMFSRLVGWVFAESGPKAPDFADVFQALSVTVDVGQLHTGLVTVGNTESRRAELIKALSDILESRCLSRQDALRLRGRLQFAGGPVFGRVAKSALAVVTFFA